MVLDDIDYPRECEVCRQTPRAGSLHCSDECERIVEGEPHTEYAIQHRTSQRFIAAPPSYGVYAEALDERGAYRWEYASLAAMEAGLLDPFRGAFDVVPVKSLCTRFPSTQDKS